METRFADAAKSIMDEVLSWDPAYATQVGWHKYDHVLGDPSSGAQLRQAARCTEMMSALRSIPDGSLSEEELIDRDLAVYILNLKRFEKEELRAHEHVSMASAETGNSLMFLFARKVPPLKQRLDALASRIERIPDYLEESRKALVAPYRMWNEAAHESGEELPSLLKSIRQMAQRKCTDTALCKRIGRAVTVAIDSVKQHNSWLRDDVIPIARTRSTISPELYARYFEVNGYGLSPDEALTVAETYLRLTRASMLKAAKSWDRKASIENASKAMRDKHPKNFRAVLQNYRKATLEARAFLSKARLLTLPKAERLLIIETPDFMKPFCPFAAQYEPGRFDGSRTGWFMVTTDDGNKELLREHNYAAILNTAVHEGYPGHHLHGICANTNPSHIRIIMASVDFSEGWGLYCEDMMLAAGFNNNPFGRLVTTEALRYRIARLIADVKLAKGDMTVESAARFLRGECGTEANAAFTEARSCAMHPTYFSSYLIGKLALLQLREEVERAMGPRFSLKFFHDSLLYSGCIPMSFIRRAVNLRLKQEFGLDLGPHRESLYEFAMKKARTGSA